MQTIATFSVLKGREGQKLIRDAKRIAKDRDVSFSEFARNCIAKEVDRINKRDRK